VPYDGETFLAGLAVYVVLRENDKFFALRRKNSSWKNGYYSLPAGRVEEKETFAEAAIREAYEESGVRIKPEDLRLYSVINRRKEKPDTDWLDMFFEATQWEGTPHIHEKDKFDHVGWFEKDQLNQLPLIENQLDGLSDIDKSGISYRFVDLTEVQVQNASYR